MIYSNQTKNLIGNFSKQIINISKFYLKTKKVNYGLASCINSSDYCQIDQGFEKNKFIKKTIFGKDFDSKFDQFSTFNEIEWLNNNFQDDSINFVNDGKEVCKILEKIEAENRKKQIEENYRKRLFISEKNLVIKEIVYILFHVKANTDLLTLKLNTIRLSIQRNIKNENFKKEIDLFLKSIEIKNFINFYFDGFVQLYYENYEIEDNEILDIFLSFYYKKEKYKDMKQILFYFKDNSNQKNIFEIKKKFKHINKYLRRNIDVFLKNILSDFDLVKYKISIGRYSKNTN